MRDYLQELGMEVESEANSISPLALAYLGDAVYEIYVRREILKQKDLSVNKLHKKATKFVKAEAQSKVVLALEKELSQEEWAIVKKGRNQKSKTMPKNASVKDYRYATGFEALLGFLCLRNQTKRVIEIMEKAVEIILKEEE